MKAEDTIKLLGHRIKNLEEENKAIIHMINDKKIEAFKAGVKHAHDIECPVCGSKTN